MTFEPIGDDELLVLHDLGYTPEIAAALGHMCVAWAALEWALFCLFHRLSDQPTALARASFYSHFSTRSRAELVLSAASMVLRGSQKREAAYKALDKLLKRVNRTAKKRNAYIHDPWAMEPIKPETTCQMRLSGGELEGQGEHVAEKDLFQLTQQIAVWGERIQDFDQRIAPLVPASLEKLDHTRAVSLVFAKTKRRRDRPPAD